jgi:plastocyanin
MDRAARVGSGLLFGAGVCALAVACGESTTAPSTPPTATNIITITSSGVSPQHIAVPRGSQVTFVNNDSRIHDMQSNPHPEHNDCPELEHVGSLRVGESRQSGNLNIAMTCGYHDNRNEGIDTLKGTILVQ